MKNNIFHAKFTSLTAALSLAVLISACEQSKSTDENKPSNAVPAASAEINSEMPDPKNLMKGAKNILSDLSVVKLSSDQFDFVEGPAYDGDKRVFFTDIPKNAIHTYDLESGEFSLFMSDSQASNGLMFDKENHLLACEQETGGISRINLQDKSKTVIAKTYDNLRFNRPNDLVVDKSGGIYFTDPTWSDEYPQEFKGVYYRSTDGEIRLLVKDFDKPNGIILSPDESMLYVADTARFEIRRFAVTAPGVLGEETPFATLEKKDDADSSGADGMAITEDGTLFVTYRAGVAVFTAQGAHIGTIELPESPSNCTFAGASQNILFVTARKNVYTIELPVKGLYFPQ